LAFGAGELAGRLRGEALVEGGFVSASGGNGFLRRMGGSDASREGAVETETRQGHEKNT
jgi:hypothetical protein